MALHAAYVQERSCANDAVIYVITSAIEDNYLPIEQLTFHKFSVGGRQPARILGPGSTEHSNSSGRQASSCLCDACEEWWLCALPPQTLWSGLTMPAQ